MKDETGRMRTGVPTMFVCAPIRDANFQVVAVLGLRIRPEREFTRILQLGRIRRVGRNLRLRQDGPDGLQQPLRRAADPAGSVARPEDSQSILNISLRDPGGNMTAGLSAQGAAGRTAADQSRCGGGRRHSRASMWTAIATIAACQSSAPGSGCPSTTWASITEIDYAEAFRPLTILQWAFYSLFALLAVSSVAIFVFTLVVARLQREAQKAAIEAKQLGQYRLEERLGAGAMGVVYKGHHAMLRRPTAIKMLNVDKVNEASIQRFEREVQITCQLNNPNTVAIYDYGRTPEGVFYYAMEYLDGIDLQSARREIRPAARRPRDSHPAADLRLAVRSPFAGPGASRHQAGQHHAQPPRRRAGRGQGARLRPGQGPRRRRSRPARRGGDGGHAALHVARSDSNARPRSMPAAICTPSGAVGYFLLTGQPVFEAASLVELCQQHVDSMPESPSQRLGRTISAELEGALLACLEKSRAKRPQTARDLAALPRLACADRRQLDDRRRRSLVGPPRADACCRRVPLRAHREQPPKGRAAPDRAPLIGRAAPQRPCRNRR